MHRLDLFVDDQIVVAGDPVELKACRDLVPEHFAVVRSYLPYPPASLICCPRGSMGPSPRRWFGLCRLGSQPGAPHRAQDRSPPSVCQRPPTHAGRLSDSPSPPLPLHPGGEPAESAELLMNPFPCGVSAPLNFFHRRFGSGTLGSGPAPRRNDLGIQDNSRSTLHFPFHRAIFLRMDCQLFVKGRAGPGRAGLDSCCLRRVADPPRPRTGLLLSSPLRRPGWPDRVSTGNFRCQTTPVKVGR